MRGSINWLSGHHDKSWRKILSTNGYKGVASDEYQWQLVDRHTITLARGQTASGLQVLMIAITYLCSTGWPSVRRPYSREQSDWACAGNRIRQKIIRSGGQSYRAILPSEIRIYLGIFTSWMVDLSSHPSGTKHVDEHMSTYFYFHTFMSNTHFHEIISPTFCCQLFMRSHEHRNMFVHRNDVMSIISTLLVQKFDTSEASLAFSKQ
jgi:hypothetical protein